jgi:hypothetical protein
MHDERPSGVSFTVDHLRHELFVQQCMGGHVANQQQRVRELK